MIVETQEQMDPYIPSVHQLYADVMSGFIVNKENDSNIRNCFCIAGIVVEAVRTPVI